MSIYAVSDLHGYLPNWKFAPDDLLIIAGDICPDYPESRGSAGFPQPDGQRKWLRTKFRSWLESLGCPFFCTWGNHDWLKRFDEPGIVDELINIPLITGTGPNLSLWLTPWSNQFMSWAWMESPTELGIRYSNIPEGVDIIVSHQPPYGYGDQMWTEHLGSRELLATLNRVKPKVVICGHIHSGHGLYEYVTPDGHKVKVYNVAVVDEQYKLVHGTTRIEVE